MRQFDTYQSYLDNLGDPLVGRLRFRKLDGSPAVIYDENGTPLSNPILTDASGRTEKQVFLDDHDYMVYFDKYVGGSVMTDDVEDIAWEECGSAINLYNTVGINVNVEGGSQAVSTVAELKSLDPATNSHYITLNGYYKEGDKPAVSYVWMENSTRYADGGSVISSNKSSKGRWVLIPSFQYVDVRHFGAFPSSVSDASVEQRYAIQKADAYANRIGCPIYFTADDEEFYYDVSGLTMSNIESSEKARLFTTGGYNVVLNDVKQVYCSGNVSEEGTGEMTVRGKSLSASFNAAMNNTVVLEPEEELVLDKDYVLRSVAFSNVRVDVQVDQSSGAFENCTFSGTGKFLAEKILFFKDCEIHESMFEDFDPDYLELDGCYSSIYEWKDLYKYVRFMVATGKSEIDLYGGTVVGELNFPEKDLYIKNANVEGPVACNSFKGVNVKAQSVDAKSYDMQGCDTTVTGNLGGFVAKDCTLFIGQAWVTSNTSITGCNISGSSTSYIMIYPDSGKQMSNIVISRNVFDGCVLEITTIPFGGEVQDAMGDVYVSDFDFVDNKITLFIMFATVKEGDETLYDARKNFRNTQGRYRVEGNYSFYGKRYPETRFTSEEYEYVDDSGNLYTPYAENGYRKTTGQNGPFFCIRKFVWSFGEEFNAVDYGIDYLKIDEVEFHWKNSYNEDLYWRLSEKGSIPEVIDIYANGGSTIGTNWVPDEVNTGSLVPGFYAKTKARFKAYRRPEVIEEME